MSNIASFYMRVRGTRENCESFIWKIPADTDITEEQGTKDDSMFYLCGECDNGMKYSFFDDMNTLSSIPDTERKIKYVDTPPITIQASSRERLSAVVSQPQFWKNPDSPEYLSDLLHKSETD